MILRLCRWSYCFLKKKSSNRYNLVHSLHSPTAISDDIKVKTPYDTMVGQSYWFRKGIYLT